MACYGKVLAYIRIITIKTVIIFNRQLFNFIDKVHTENMYIHFILVVYVITRYTRP